MAKLLKALGADRIVRLYDIIKFNGGLVNSYLKLYRYENAQQKFRRVSQWKLNYVMCHIWQLIGACSIQCSFHIYRFDDLKIGRLVGTDKYGNKYFENNYYFYGRNRWVEYAPHVHMAYDGSQIPAEWFGWMHYKVSKIHSTTQSLTKWLENNYLFFHLQI